MKKSQIYKALSISNDLKAISKGKGLQRWGRKLAGRQSGKMLGKLFK